MPTFVASLVEVVNNPVAVLRVARSSSTNNKLTVGRVKGAGKWVQAGKYSSVVLRF